MTRSAAPALLARTDHLDVQSCDLPPTATADAEEWVKAVFSVGSAPGWVRALFGARALLAPLIGVRAVPAQDPFRVAEVRDGEALILTRDRHLDFAFGLRVDPAARRVAGTTAVELHGWRGRVYWLPVRLLHGPVLRAMMRAAARDLVAERSSRDR